MGRINFHLHRGAGTHRRRVGVGPDAAAAINDGKADLGQVEPFRRQRQQMIA